MENLSEAQIYVGTYAKYNEGSLFGKWTDLADYSGRDEFYDACYQLHSNESDPELMFQDWENIPTGLIGESWLSENVFDVIETVSNLDDTIQKAFFIWLDNTGKDIASNDIDGLVSLFEDDYQGEFENEEDFAYETVEQCYDLPEFAKIYFDYEKFARDLFISDYWFEDGFVFRSS